MDAGKRIYILSGIIMLLLVSTAAVSAGNALDNKEVIEINYVPVEMAYCIADATFDDFLSSGALPEEEFQNAVVNRIPLIIYDINGLKLYYQFNLEIDGENAGYIRAAASRVSGCAVTMVQDHPDATDYELAEEKSENIMIAKYGVAALSSPKVVCYSYPKTGIMFETRNSEGKTERIILDAHDYSIIPERKPAFNGDVGMWSVYDDIEFDSVQNRLSKWDENVKNIDFYNGKSSLIDIIARSTFNYRKIWNNNNLVAQPNHFWYCVTSGKMIAEWFGSGHTLDYIAGEMDAEKPLSDNQTVNESESNPLTQEETEMLDKMLWVPEIIFDSNTSDSVINATVDRYFGEKIQRKISDKPLYVNSYLRSEIDLFEGYRANLENDSQVEVGDPALPWVYIIVESEKVRDGDKILATYVSRKNISEELSRIGDSGIPIYRTKSVIISTSSATDNSDSEMIAALDECNRDNNVLFVLKIYLKC